MFIQDLICGTKQRNPKASAIEYGDQIKSYQQLETDVSELCALLSSRIAKDDIVAVYMPVCPELVVSMLAIMRVGGIFLPIDPVGYDKDNQQKFVISSPVATLTLKNFEQEFEQLTDLACNKVDIDNSNLAIHSYVKQGCSDADSEEAWRVDLPDDVGYLYFTSGSTGKPKGVLGRLNSLRAFIEWESELVGVSTSDRVSLLTPQTFDPFLRDVLLPLVNGATLCIPHQQLTTADSQTLCDWLNSSQITISHIVPSVFELLLDTFSTTNAVLSYSPHTLLFAGEPLTPALVRKLRKHTTFSATRLFNLYGTTESTLAKCANLITQQDMLDSTYPVGRPMPGVGVLFRNDNGVISDGFTAGEICFVGDVFSHGYFIGKNQPVEPISELITVDSKPQRICPTGDLGQLDISGLLVVKGRKDNQVKINGQRVELAEIENALEKAEHVSKAVVVIDPSVKESRLIAWVILSAQADSAYLDSLFDFLQGEIESHKVPQQILALETFPLSAHGKVDRKRLAQLIGEQIHVDNSQQAEIILLPESETEKWLVKLYKDLLHCGNVSCSDTFTRLGGRSMQALRALFKINHHFSCRLTIGEFMRASTVSNVAKVIDCYCEQNTESLNNTQSLDDKSLLSHQRRLCFYQQRFPQSVAYNMTYSLSWHGPLDERMLQQALNAVVGNHPELRSRFYFDAEGNFNRDVVRQYCADLQYHDVSNEHDVNGCQASAINEQAQSVLSIDSGKPYCFSLIKSSHQQYLLVMTLHHIVADEWSIEQLFFEWIEYYDQPAVNEISDSKDTFTIGAGIQENSFAQNIPETCKQYWLEQLDGVAPSSMLPSDYNQVSEKNKKAGVAQISLPPRLTRQCIALADKLDVSLFSFMLSAFYLLLHKYSSQSDLAIGIPVTGRTEEDALGFYVNMLCYRKQITIEQSVAGFVCDIQRLHNQNLSHSEMPFDYIVEQLCSERSDNLSPLFQHSFAFTESSKSMPEIDECIVGQPEYVSNGECKFDFSLQLKFNGEIIDGRVEYNCAAYSADNINSFLQTLDQLVSQMTLHPNRPIAELVALSSSEHQAILGWNDTSAEFCDSVNIAELIANKLNQHQDLIALRAENTTMTYRQLTTSINRLTNYLLSMGCAKGSRVAVSVAPSCNLIISMLAIMKAGAIYVPVDPSYPAARRNYMLQDSNAQLILTDDISQPLFKGSKIISVNLDQLDLSIYQDVTPDNLCGPDDIAYIIYTSGSTGNPKGVEIFHKGVCNLAEAEVDLLRVGPNSRVLQFASFSFDTSIWEMIVTLVAGGTLVVSSRQAMMPGENLAALCDQFDITHLTLPASALASMPDDSLGSLEVLIVAGEACSELLMKKWSQNRLFINSYGPTEATVSVSNAQLCAEDNKVHIGRPLANTQCWVLDESQKLLPIGAIGELYVSGVGLAKGYLNKPEITKERFILPTDPLISASRLYRTGDVVRYLSNGNLEYLGRVDEQVKIRGFRVELTEIENCLCQHEAISDAVVLATEQDNSTEIALTGYIVAESNCSAFIRDVRQHLNDLLPAYAVPQFIISLKSFPKLPNNKIDRSKLSDCAQLDSSQTQTINAASELQGVEKELAEIWLDLLGLHELDSDISFFEVGGHSLLAVKVVSMMRKKGWELDVNAFFTSAKLGYLASQCVKLVANKNDSDLIWSMPEVNDAIPLTHFQQGLWFESKKGAANTYNVCKVFAFQNDFEQVPLVQALNLVFAANDVFSTQFEEIEGVARQYRSATSHRPNLAYLREAMSEDKIIEYANTLAASPIMLGQHSPIESALLRDEKDKLYLVINVHHILLDEASMQELLLLIVIAHDAFKSNQQPDMSECKSFLAYARRCGQPSDERVIAQQNFWKNTLDKVPSGLALPYSNRVENNKTKQTQRGKTLSVQLPAVITKQVLQLAAKHMTTPMVTWLSLFLDFLQQYTKQTDLCVGIPVSDRPLEYTDTAIGLYLNTLVFRHQSSMEEQLETKLEQIKRNFIDSYAYCDTPLSKIIEWTRGDQQTDFSLFDVMFVYKHPEKNDRVDQLTVNNDTAKFPLTFFVVERIEGAVISAEFDTHLFEENDIDNLLGAFAEHVESHFEGNRRISTAELNEFVASGQQRTPESTLTAIAQFELQARITPHLIAVQTDELHLSYFELNQLANNYAENLANLTQTPISRVGILLPRSVSMIAVLLGCLKLGVAYVPLDINLPKKRFGYIVEDAGLEVVVVLDDNQLDTQAYLSSIGIQTEVVGVNSLKQGEKPENNIRYANAEPVLSALAYIIYTSGSTGQPKGVMVNNAGLCHYLCYASKAYVLSHGGSTVFHLSFAFDASITSIFVPLLNGGTLQVVPHGDEVEQLLTILTSDQPLDFIKLTPAHVDLLAQGLNKVVSSFDGALVIGGEALLRNTLVDIQAKLPNAKLINEYGPTEAIVGCCIYDASEMSCELSEAVPIGRAIKGIELVILDEQRHQVERGKMGELYICGDHLALGYLNKDELTDSKFSPCHALGLPFSGRCYATGDLVSELESGDLVFKGRIDDQIKHKGYRIELSEIEAVTRQHSSVAESAVIYTNEENRQGRILSFVTVTEQNSNLSQQHVRDYCADYLPEYMLPETVFFVDRMPLTANGKIDRNALHARLNEVAEEANYSSMTRTETMLHEMWSQLLNTRSFDVNDSFFSVGGDSIFCLQVVFKLRKQGFSINVETLLTNRTVAQLASFLDQQSIDQPNEVLSDSLKAYEGTLPLTPLQHWLFSHGGGGHEWFNQAYLYRLDRQVNNQTLETAILHTLNRHIAMRQSFSKDPQGQIQSSVAASVNTFDFSVIQTGGDSEESEIDWINKYVSKLDMAFDLTQAPLFKAWVFETQYCAQFRILFVAHHAVVDAISWSVLVDEISHSYAHPNVDPLHKRFDNSLANYTQWRNNEDISAAEVAIWEARKAQSSDPIACHYVQCCQSNVYRNCRYFSQRLDMPKTNLLEQVAARTIGLSVQEILLTALVKAIAKWSHVTQVKIDVESHGRLDHSPYDMATMVGWLTAIQPTHFSNIARSQSEDLLEQSAQQLREDPNKGIGYGEWQSSSKDGWQPDAEICFNYLGKAFTDTSSNDAVIQAMESGFNAQRHASDLNRWYLIEFDAWIEQGCCQISWTFSKALHEISSIARLADIFEQSLDDLLEASKDRKSALLVPADLPQGVSMNLSDIENVRHYYPDAVQVLSATPMQQGMAFHTRYNNGGPVYHEQIVYNVCVPIDLDHFHQAWQVLLARHAMLRAALVIDRFGSPVVVVNRSVHAVVGYIDLTGVLHNEQEDYIESILDTDFSCPFVLDKSPLIRANLIATGASSAQLFISHHHAILDGWSLALIIDELNTLLGQEEQHLSTIPCTNSDLTLLQHFSEYVSQQSYPDIAFWEGILEQNMISQSLPFVTQTDSDDTSTSAFHELEFISKQDMEVVNQCASELNVTLSTIIQGAWALALHYFSRDDDTVFGVTLSGRSIDVKQAESLVGLCINTLPMRVRIEPECDCGDWLSNIQQMMYSIQNHSQTSLPELTKHFQPVSRSGLFDSIIVLTNYQSEIDTKKDAVVNYKYSRETTNFPLTLVISESKDGLECRLSGLHERINPLWLKPMLRVFSSSIMGLAQNKASTVLAAMQAGSDLMPDDLSCIVGHSALLDGLTPSARLAQYALTHPQHIAVTDAEGELTYSQLNAYVNEFGLKIIDQLNDIKQLSQQQPVIGICCKRNRALLTGLLSCLRLEAVFLPLDPDLPLQRLTYMAENAQVALIISDDPDRFSGSALERYVLHIEPTLDSIQCDGNGAIVQPLNISDDDTAYIMYTSGSTGKPKGVKVAIGSFHNYLEHASTTYSSDQPISSCVHSSIGFDGTLTSLFVPIMTGGAVKMIAEENALGELANEIQRTTQNLLIKITPSHLGLLAAQLNGEPSKYLKAIIIGGEALDYRHLSAFKHCAPDALFVNEYGPTEATVGCCVNIFDPFELEQGAVPIGCPIQNTELLVCTDNMEILPRGAIGELCIAGMGVAKEYINLAPVTETKFVLCTGPDNHNRRVYRTGDMIYAAPDGKLHYIGRRDDQVKVNGVRIELGEIEEAIRHYARVENVAAVVSLAQPNQLVAFVAGCEDKNSDQLRQKLLSMLPNYMLPRHFIYVDSLPLTVNGKIDRPQLMQVDVKDEKQTNDFVEPETEVQHQICSIFSELLTKEKISIRDDFFALGGHSLIAMQLLSRIAQRFGVSISLKTLFSCSAVWSLAALVEQQVRNNSTPSAKDNSKSSNVLTSIPSIQRASRRIN